MRCAVLLALALCTAAAPAAQTVAGALLFADGEPVALPRWDTTVWVLASLASAFDRAAALAQVSLDEGNAGGHAAARVAAGRVADGGADLLSIRRDTLGRIRVAEFTVRGYDIVYGAPGPRVSTARFFDADGRAVQLAGVASGLGGSGCAGDHVTVTLDLLLGPAGRLLTATPTVRPRRAREAVARGRCVLPDLDPSLLLYPTVERLLAAYGAADLDAPAWTVWNADGTREER